VDKFGFIGITYPIQLFDLVEDRAAQVVDIPAFRRRNEHAAAIGLALPALAELAHDLLFYAILQPGIEGVRLVFVDLIKNNQYGFVVGTQLLEGLVYHSQLFLVTRMGDIDDMQQDIRLAHLIQRALEALHQVMGQLADEPYGIAEEEWRGLEDDLPGRGIERGEKLVFRKYVTFAQ